MRSELANDLADTVAVWARSQRRIVRLAAWANRNEDPETIAARQRAHRSITHRIEPDGMVTTTIRQPPLDAAQLHGRLEFIIRTGEVTPRRRGASESGENASASASDATAITWPTFAQQRADALMWWLRNSAGAPAGGRAANGGAEVELIVHVRGDGCTLDDGTPVPDSTVASLVPSSLIRALVHDSEGRPVNASGRRRYPTTRQKRVVKERDRCCVDCGSDHFLEYDHVPSWEETRHTLVEELQVRCSACHRRRHQMADESETRHVA